MEVKKGKGKNVPPIPHSSYQWEAVATNLDEFLSVSVSLFFSKLHIACHFARENSRCFYCPLCCHGISNMIYNLIIGRANKDS